MNKLKLFHIIDPDINEVRYIGATKHRYPSAILAQYICASGACGRPLCAWLTDLKKVGKRPKVETVKEIDSLGERGKYIDNFPQKSKLLNVDKVGNDIYINAGNKNTNLKRTTNKKKISLLIKFYKIENRFPLSKLGQTRWGDDNPLCEKLKIPHIGTYIKVFGSYKNACNLALREITGDPDAVYDNGIKPFLNNKNIMTKQEIALLFLEFKNKHGYFPTVNDKTRKWNDGFGEGINGLSQGNIYKKFGNLTKARAYAEELNNEP